MLKVVNEVPTYEETEIVNILVHSHWNYNDRVVIYVGSTKVTVLAEEMKAAIDNATNIER